jgi:hypothetical protein
VSRIEYFKSICNKKEVKNIILPKIMLSKLAFNISSHSHLISANTVHPVSFYYCALIISEPSPTILPVLFPFAFPHSPISEIVFTLSVFLSIFKSANIFGLLINIVNLTVLSLKSPIFEIAFVTTSFTACRLDNFHLAFALNTISQKRANIDEV